MPAKPFLHDLSEFPDLIRIVADERRILPVLIEKDYWVMHCLHGLAAQGFSFELKGGTSLSKGFGIINRFSEDIDIRIDPGTAGFEVFTGKNHDKPISPITGQWTFVVITPDIHSSRSYKQFRPSSGKSSRIPRTSPPISCATTTT